MRRDNQAGRGPAAALWREAIAERPPFSEELHDRLVRRLAASRPPRPVPRKVAAAPATLIRRMRIPLALSVAVMATTVALVGWNGRDALPRPPAGLSAAGGLPDVAPPEEPLGIDRLPTPGEIEEEVRESVTTLAASLLGVPEWTAVADFDAGGFLGGGGGR